MTVIIKKREAICYAPFCCARTSMCPFSYIYLKKEKCFMIGRPFGPAAF